MPPLSPSQREKRAAAERRLGELEAEFTNYKALIDDALKIKQPHHDRLGYLHRMDHGYLKEPIDTTDQFFRDAKELARRATSTKSLDAFVRKLNSYDNSGGKHALQSAVAALDRKLRSKRRDDVLQITLLDEDYFKRYLKAHKPPLRVFRGDGREIDADSLDNYVFQDVPWGGTPDVSFGGVVGHTHSNTDKNGMVSATSRHDVAHFYATTGHEYGLVVKFKLERYIHVANLLRQRNFKNRFPGQFEILAPGAIPASNAVSVTLYEGERKIARVKNVKGAGAS